MSVRCLLAEFDTPDALVRAARDFRDSGLGALDTFTPYPIRELEPLLGVKRSPIPRWALLGGLSGAVFAYVLEWWCAAVSYPVDVGGRPLHSAPAFVPITFETAILAAATTAFVTCVLHARLLRLYDPVFDAPGFERASVDRFWLAVSADESLLRPLHADEPSIRARLVGHGALQIFLLSRPA